MSEMYDSIMHSFDLTLEDTKRGKIKTKLLVRPVGQYNADRVKKLRNDMGLSQAMFAGILGVSKKAVEAWESGRNVPKGPAARMMDLMSEKAFSLDTILN